MKRIVKAMNKNIKVILKVVEEITVVIDSSLISKTKVTVQKKQKHKH